MDQQKLRFQTKKLHSGKFQISFTTEGAGGYYGYLLAEPNTAVADIIEKIGRHVSAIQSRERYFHRNLFSFWQSTGTLRKDYHLQKIKIMIRVNENIRVLRKKLNLTQDQFALKLGIKRSLVGAYEEGRAEPRAELLHRIASLGNITLDALIGTDLTKTGHANYQRGKEVVVVTIDSTQKENIEFVPVKAAAGYLNGFADAEYIKELPKFHLPMLKQGTYRAFEIKGDSMLPLLPGSIVVGEYVEKLNDIRSGKTYVIVTGREGVVYKRVFNYLDENGKLFLVSDNRQYSPYQVDGEEVVEAWAAKAYISVQFPEAEPKTDVSVEQLASVVLDLQKEIFQLKEKEPKK